MKLRDRQLEVLWIARIDYSRNSGIKEHAHDFYQLLLIIEGEGTVKCNGQLYPISSKHCYLFKKGVQHSFSFINDSITIDIKFSLSEELEETIMKSEWDGGVQFDNVSLFKELVQLSSLNLKEANDLVPFRVDVGFKGILLKILQDKLTENKSNQVPVTISESNEGFPMVQYLKQNLSSTINLKEMADHFGFHPHYLIELFKKNLGTTPMQYLQTLRIEKAKEYLEFSSHSISEIADLIGLTPQYLSRLCVERYGKSPSKIREQMRTVVGKDIILEQDFMITSQPVITTTENI
ncbi:AraC family transcriptional regulator [Pullulanibacillus sp. KACC 23026]|uniref:AraC family transcriptional regulator n=1 Tax=Pullulanibacillus sp. KACC 23026 TaxID=3028315 RepID=UPI0023AF4F09|nr:AraC family transcriptional regulator [Pullulanibacillus sp. KACC 23026]WEG13463.1 AraC family transcriptional regulator [Pullulanibacillus sp. KACC 23026]